MGIPSSRHLARGMGQHMGNANVNVECGYGNGCFIEQADFLLLMERSRKLCTTHNSGVAFAFAVNKTVQK